jgi:putative glutamine amidotransferase
MKKVIVPLQFFYSDQKLHFRRLGARESYLQKLSKYDITPIFVSTFSTAAVLDELFEDANGLLLMGGADVTPSLYGMTNIHPETYGCSLEQDRLEIELVKKAVHQKRPVLGICRGCQVLNVALGGTLIQHLPDITAETHSLELYDELLTAPKHEVSLLAGSKINKLLLEEKGEINSAHHQAVENVAPDLIVSGRSNDGIAEVIEHKDPKLFCFGLQAHPETEENGFFEPVFKGFAERL